MNIFSFGECIFHFEQEELLSFLKKNYSRHYQEERFQHTSQNNPRLPRIKITDDIVSFTLYFIAPSDREYCLYFDGYISENSILIDLITFHPDEVEVELNSSEIRYLVDILKKLSFISRETDYLFYRCDDSPFRIVKGNIQNYQVLIKELFDAIPSDQKENHEPLFHWLIDSANQHNR